MGPTVSTSIGARSRDAHALEDLLARTAAADEAAFRALYDRTSGRLFAVCLRIARHRRLAEELLHETYVRIWMRASEFDAAHGGALGAIAAKFELSALGRCLGELADGERHAIILAYRDGLTYEQLAVLLGGSDESIKMSIARGLLRLRDCLEPP